MRAYRYAAAAAVALLCAGAIKQGAVSLSPAVAAEQAAAALSPDGYISMGPVLTGAVTSSYLRFINGTDATTTFSMRVFGYPSGTEYTTTPLTLDAPAHAAPQKSAADLSSSIAPRTGDTAVTFFLKNDKAGQGVAVQHVTYNSVTGFFENVGVCTYDVAFLPDVTVLGAALFNVHTSQVAGGGYPSTIQIINPDATSRTVTGTVYDAATGASIGTYPSTVIPANGAVTRTMASLQTALNFTPTASQLHVNIVFRSGDSSAYTAVPQHMVTQTSSGATFNLTSFCPLNPVHTTTPKPGGGTGVNPSAAS